MNGAQILPLTRAHLRTRRRTAWWIIREQIDDDGVGLLYQEAAKLIQPDIL